ncbi:MAG TPA: hypothetical protein VLJ68_04975 [Chitinophagaceae bacterium]|nr:hypothetical protein [Chitinophagaceae bacterium]
MKKSILFRYMAGIVIIALSLVFLSSAPKKKTDSSCCKKNMQCPGKKSNSISPSNGIWETFTRQFVIISPIHY